MGGAEKRAHATLGIRNLCLSVKWALRCMPHGLINVSIPAHICILYKRCVQKSRALIPHMSHSLITLINTSECMTKQSDIFFVCFLRQLTVRRETLTFIAWNLQPFRGWNQSPGIFFFFFFCSFNLLNLSRIVIPPVPFCFHANSCQMNAQVINPLTVWRHKMLHLNKAPLKFTKKNKKLLSV